MTRIFISLMFALLIAGTASTATARDVVVTIKPLHSLVQGVMGDTGEATLLIEGAQSLHGFSLKPSQVKYLQKARIVFYVNETMESFLKTALDSLPEGVHKVPLAHLPDIELLERREGGAWDEHDHDHGHSHTHEHEGEHGLEEDNLHIWLDPDIAKSIVRAVAEELAGLYPENRGIYMANADALTARLIELDTELAEKLAPVQGQPYVVLHDAYPYFERRYNLMAVGSLTLDPETPASAKKLRDIREKLKETSARCIFREPQFDDRLVRTAAEGMDIKFGTLDPLGADIDPGAELYFSLLTGLADNVADCLGK
ncbi:zinc ABC transporter substrate-binding protein [uncultured Sneathiella sp.]|uniref:zinc ABC transporter substrate-binding protein n=1 Tax=uncultured Sneathiella sp. TaxID=879315 RepID=UPI0030EEC2C1|tara:strand:+ start:52173 stop:53114 length:942 start_codon:yes stop_codon:yes gene_type:complete